jgi:hypothetical protein
MGVIGVCLLPQFGRATLKQAFSTLQAPVLVASQAEIRAAQTALDLTGQRRQAERDAAWLASRAR